LLAAIATAAIIAADAHHQQVAPSWTAVWSIWSNCDCSGPANSEHVVPVCALYTISPRAVQIKCASDGQSVIVSTPSGGVCGGGGSSHQGSTSAVATAANGTSYPVGRCLKGTPASGTVMSRFECVRKHTPRKMSIVGKQYADAKCAGPAVIAEVNYVTGCYPSCAPPSPNNPLPNLFQVADASGTAAPSPTHQVPVHLRRWRQRPATAGAVKSK
jgi:hypothetical protein